MLICSRLTTSHLYPLLSSDNKITGSVFLVSYWAHQKNSVISESRNSTLPDLSDSLSKEFGRWMEAPKCLKWLDLWEKDWKVQQCSSFMSLLRFGGVRHFLWIMQDTCLLQFRQARGDFCCMQPKEYWIIYKPILQWSASRQRNQYVFVKCDQVPWQKRTET